MSRRPKVGTNRPVLMSRRELLENLSSRIQRAQDKQTHAPETDPGPEESDTNGSLENMATFGLASDQANLGEIKCYSSSAGLKLCNVAI